MGRRAEVRNGAWPRDSANRGVRTADAALGRQPAFVSATKLTALSSRMCSVEIVSENTHRVLEFVSALNRQGVKPARDVVDAFGSEPDPVISRHFQRTRSLGGVAFATLSVYGGQEEPYSDYLERIGLAVNFGGVLLTEEGQALLKALNTPKLDEATADVFEIVLRPENPFAYAQALGALSRHAEECMLVEPYFRLEQLIDIAELDNVTRVMTGTKLNNREREVLATGLASVPNDRPLEVRMTDDLHDRYLIPREGPALMLGASLGGIGKRVSTLTTLGDVASQALRDAHEALWARGMALRSKAVADEDLPGDDDEAAPA